MTLLPFTPLISSKNSKCQPFFIIFRESAWNSTQWYIIRISLLLYSNVCWIYVVQIWTAQKHGDIFAPRKFMQFYARCSLKEHFTYFGNGWHTFQTCRNRFYQWIFKSTQYKVQMIILRLYKISRFDSTNWQGVLC